MPYPKVESLFSSGRRANTGTDDALSQSTTSSRSRSFSASDVAESVLEERTLTAPKVRASTQAKTPDVSNPKMYACTGCDKTFARRYDRNRHARKHTGEKVGRSDPVSGHQPRKLMSSPLCSPTLAPTLSAKQTLFVPTPYSMSRQVSLHESGHG